MLPFQILFENFDLYRQLYRRETETKYKGSYLGLFWSIITPIMMLIIYTFVFGIVFKSKWDYQVTDSRSEFAITLFVGIIIYSFFSDALNKSTVLVYGNANYVKKVIFPLELLSIAHVSSLLVQVGISVLIILIGKLFLMHVFDFYFLLFPFVLIPLIFFTLGLSWFFSAIGVFIKDIQQIVSIIVLMIGYMTPVFYPVTFVPQKLRWIIYLNPLTYIVNFSRNLLIYGKIPEIDQFLLSIVSCYLVMMLGLLFFRKVKSEFSDML